MLQDFTYDASLGVVRITISSDLDADVYRQALVRLTTSSEFPPNVHTVWDIRSVQFWGVDMAVFRQMKEVRAEFADIRAGSKSAILVPGQQEQRLMSLYDAFAIDDEQHMKIVQTNAEAEAWCS